MKPFKPPTPLATNSLLGLCVAVQAAMAVGSVGFGQAVIFNFGLIPARITAMLVGNAPLLTSAPTLVTHMFLHSGWLHLGLNLLFLAWVGRYVEWVTGRWSLVGLFLAGGIIGGVAQVVADPQGTVPVVGASGAIAAIFGAYAVLFATSRMAPRRFIGIAIPGETLTSLWYAATWIGLQLLTGLAFNTGPGGGIAIWTHIGGFLTGLVVARFWGKGPRPY
ncbi:rhomboid family intramembrane serine protease [Polymorphobacter fuscus]|uniref:Rhomboid family intramembrane serine protease n=1 Tax=Sandarakinorhabdus fusca TaxID=1439888 RepID=A0A7C9KW23_9SPHN|nr:rhomboid family intramembrane serine protease [Polymorphobacter fuscus]KAB7648754.1 rhomboid family intramembrane serine protease [Polymorphobacter fuscus]MQT16322.1 rhomboid family intramembrane serine protease [Polymorphobacter fuscus]NJC07390.1 membrane associated rhomboid family serine protease [Polymorphobacter fuscus]